MHTLTLTVQLYLLILIIFLFYYQDVAQNQQINSFSDLQSFCADQCRKVIFLVVLGAFLGSPPTSGFFFKAEVFVNLSTKGIVLLMGAVVLNLIMLVFYLQASRHPQQARKKRVRTSTLIIRTAPKGVLIAGSCFVAFAAWLLPALVDVLLAIMG